MCAHFNRVNYGGPGLISGPDHGSRIGWTVRDLQLVVTGGLQQNDTVTGGKHAYCPIITTQPKLYGSPTRGMLLKNLVIHSVAPARYCATVEGQPALFWTGHISPTFARFFSVLSLPSPS